MPRIKYNLLINNKMAKMYNSNVYVHLVIKIISKNMTMKVNQLLVKYDPIPDTYQSVNDHSKFLHDWLLVQLRNYNL